MKLKAKHIPLVYIFTLFSGTLFFIPTGFVSRFITAQTLWMQIGIATGVFGFIFIKRKQLLLPSYRFLLLLLISAIYYLWREKWHLEAFTSVVLYSSVFILFSQSFKNEKGRNNFITVCAIMAVMLCIWCAGQIIGWLPSFHNTLDITGPFDNPAGISAALSLLLPFTLYKVDKSYKWMRVLHIIISMTIVIFIILSGARAAMIAATVIILTYTIRWVKTKTKIKLSVAHYFLVIAIGILLFIGLYSFKKDSANGRILIWKCTGHLIVQKPILGYGSNGFTANYMNEQALYFTKHPESKYAILADNIRHPFNEYLKSTAEYGVVGLILVILILLYPLYQSRKNKSGELFAIRLSLLAIAICALFSYPLNYPFIRLMAIVLLSFLLAHSNSEHRVMLENNYLTKSIILLTSVGLLSTTCFQSIHEREWHTIAHKSLRGETLQMLPRYKSLYRYLRHNDLFLYNYAAELNVAEHFDESLQIARECNNLWADYDLQMLMADNCLQLKQYNETESYLQKAAAMCPVKFMPLYQLTKLYMETERKEEARSLAQKIVDKDVKIPSPIINSIKSKMRSLLNERNN